MKNFWLIAVFMPGPIAWAQPQIVEPKIAFEPRYYMCFKTPSVLNIDGKLDETSWKKAEWTEKFVDIEGATKPKPRFETRAKMLWDDQYFYVGAEIDEPNIRAAMKERDAVLYEENDFEIYIDPDGDTQVFCEMEINALNTVADIMHIRPYRDDGGPSIRAWDIKGLKTGVSIAGTPNDPRDKDKAWTIEIAIPWDVIKEIALVSAVPPGPDDHWRINFSRVEHRLAVENNVYVNAKDPVRGKLIAEDNWVWSPQGLIDIQYPEMWGFVQFTKSLAGSPREYCDEWPDDQVKWALRKIYYRERRLKDEGDAFASSLDELGLKNDKKLKIKDWDFPPLIQTTKSLFEAIYKKKNGSSWHIRQDGLVWKEEAGGR